MLSTNQRLKCDSQCGSHRSRSLSSCDLGPSPPIPPIPPRWSEASLTGDLEKKAKLVLAEEKDQKKGRGLSLGPWVRSEPQEAALKEMVMVIGDTYMSKRSLPENNPFFGGSGRARVRFRVEMLVSLAHVDGSARATKAICGSFSWQ